LDNRFDDALSANPNRKAVTEAGPKLGLGALIFRSDLEYYFSLGLGIFRRQKKIAMMKVSEPNWPSFGII
jgi:hypothetical protein